MKVNQNNENSFQPRNKLKRNANKEPVILELAYLVISLLCGNKPVFSSCKLVYKSTLLVGIMGYSRLGNQPADNSHREKYQILTNHKLKRKTLWKKEN